MSLHACPTCREPVPWEGNPFRPFCSERCRLRDLGAWSSEAYRIPAKPDEEQGESWGEEPGET
ncbi:MAG: DNA gyrase inhibitor YacG [Holophagaceae bacterium]